MSKSLSKSLAFGAFALVASVGALLGAYLPESLVLSLSPAMFFVTVIFVSALVLVLGADATAALVIAADLGVAFIAAVVAGCLAVGGNAVIVVSGTFLCVVAIALAIEAIDYARKGT
ncbi:hypothetical protein [Stappia sp. P2PMeth1]|uniref:hypothetical protein n=1 Tax=Stappia sp. P2PMeth1 TaxID=2003586 RepID=UPI0016465A40|nr:hypothetical protein [Stappia sp. P2PMeth1]